MRASLYGRTRGDPPGETGGSLVASGPPAFARQSQATISIHVLAVRFVVPPRQALGPVPAGRPAA
ncbi:MAG TPA: hypothetical protein VE776_02420, partial [Actinomycetota bacterium]|nr:hypothetical protein [Actinomycetota bacterium]